MKLAIFDFDGTITTDDSLFHFIRYTHGNIKTFFGVLLLSPVLILYLIKVLPNWMTKEIVLKLIYGGWNIERFNQCAVNFAKTDLNKIVKQSALDKIKWHKQEGHRIVVVSASIENYLGEWCRNNQLDLLGTLLEVKEGRITGKISGVNCHGQEKVRRIKETYNLKDYDYVYAYGDTSGDLALKSIAQEFYYKVFN